jgi:hypothetical protein
MKAEYHDRLYSKNSFSASNFPQGVISYTLLFAWLMVTGVQAAEEQRQLIQLPEPMQAHMLANMRDHLVTIDAITRLLSEGEYGEAAETAESRLGMSSLQVHGAEHMAPFMPERMRAIGTDMHRAASRFAVSAKDAELTGNLAAALEGLSRVTAQCVACHSAFRVH